MKLKHTPGPWESVDCDTKSEGKRIFAGSKYIGFIGNSDDDIGTSENNARLIAAAPEMLEALIKEARNQVTRLREKSINDFVSHIGKTKLMTIIESATGLSIEEVLKDAQKR